MLGRAIDPKSTTLICSACMIQKSDRENLIAHGIIILVLALMIFMTYKVSHIDFSFVCREVTKWKVFTRRNCFPIRERSPKLAIW